MEGLLRLVEWAGQLRDCGPGEGRPPGTARARASSPDDGGDECSGRGTVGVVSEATRNDILGLLGMLLERWAVSAGLAAEGAGVSAVRLGELGEGKIQGWHRDRLAVVYVRQSSRQRGRPRLGPAVCPPGDRDGLRDPGLPVGGRRRAQSVICQHGTEWVICVLA
jgi:hypothetical protein